MNSYQLLRSFVLYTIFVLWNYENVTVSGILKINADKELNSDGDYWNCCFKTISGLEAQI